MLNRSGNVMSAVLSYFAPRTSCFPDERSVEWYMPLYQVIHQILSESPKSIVTFDWCMEMSAHSSLSSFERNWVRVEDLVHKKHTDKLGRIGLIIKCMHFMKYNLCYTWYNPPRSEKYSTIPFDFASVFGDSVHLWDCSTVSRKSPGLIKQNHLIKNTKKAVI